MTHWITLGVAATDLAKVAAVRDWPMPHYTGVIAGEDPELNVYRFQWGVLRMKWGTQ